MTVVDLDPDRYPNLMGVERPFFEYWSENILRDDDPHRDRWIDYEVETLSTKAWTVRGLRKLGMEILDVDPAFGGRPIPGPAFVGSVLDELRQSFTIIARYR